MLNQDQINKLKNINPFFLGSTRSAHEANKREAFDGMRAYHQSEIDHKKDAIDILKTLLTTVVFIFTGLIAFIYTQTAPPHSSVYLAWIIAAINLLSTIVIVVTTNMKITQDNKRYSKYRQEYIVEREIIGLEDELKAVGYDSDWSVIKTGKDKSGFRYTKLILWWFGSTIILIGITGALLVQQATKERNKFQQPKPQTHVVIDKY